MNHFEELRKIQPKGPLMNSQFWVGCPTYWKDPTHNKLDVGTFQDDLVEMISKGIGFNLHMFHGGTNFGLSAGLKTEGKYCLTSYDFDAPISESGDPTLKYFHIQKFLTEVRREIDELTEEEKNEEIQRILEGIESPEPTEKGEYGSVTLTPVDSLLNTQMTCCLKSCISLFPKSMEEMNLRDGLMAYSTVLKDGAEKDAELRGTVRDRAYVILNNTETIGIIENGDALKLPKTLEEKSKLTFLVENQGRRPYKSGRTVTKGLFSMYLNGSLLDNWTITTFSIQGPKSVLKLQNNLRRKVRNARQTITERQPFADHPFMTGGVKDVPKQDEVIAPPAFYIGTFILPKERLENQDDVANEDVTDEDKANEDHVNEDHANESNANEDNVNEDKANEVKAHEDTVNEDANEAKAAEDKAYDELNLDSDITYQDFGDIIKDSYLNMTGWKKGIVYLNSFCLGRYWDVGPQRTLFVPGSVFLPYPWKNKITVLELEAAPKSLKLAFTSTSDPELADVSDEPAFGEARHDDNPREEGDEKASEEVPNGTAADGAPNGTAADGVPSGTAVEKVPSVTGEGKKESVPEMDTVKEE